MWLFSSRDVFDRPADQPVVVELHEDVRDHAAVTERLLHEGNRRAVGTEPDDAPGKLSTTMAGEVQHHPRARSLPA